MSDETSLFVVSTQAISDGVTIRMRISSTEDDPIRLSLTPHTKADSAYRDQLERAGQRLASFLTSPILRAACDQRRLSRGIQIDLDFDADVAEGSHGSAILIGAMAHLLGVGVRSGRVFSGSIASDQPDPEYVALEPIANVSAKAVAAGKQGINELFYYRSFTRDDPEEELLRRHTYQHYSGAAEAHCLPVALPKRVHWSNILNLGLTTESLWETLVDAPHGGVDHAVELFKIMSVKAYFEPVHLEAFPYGIGSVLARKRSEGAEFEGLLAWPLISHVLDIAPHEHVPELLRAALGEKPNSTPAEEFRNWLHETGQHRHCRWSDAPTWMLIRLYDLACSQGWVPLADQRSFEAKFIPRLQHDLRSAAAAPKGNEEIIKLIIGALLALRCRHERLLISAHKELQSIMPRAMPQVAAFIDANSKRLLRKYLAAENRVPETPAKLTLSFRERGEELVERNCPCCGRPEAVAPINPLGVTYRTLDGVDVTLPAPILLVGSEQLIGGSYCHRADFRPAQSAMAGLRRAEIQAILGRFGREPSRIEFELEASNNRPRQRSGVTWDPVQSPFPPAIDAQFMAYALQKWQRQSPELSVDSIIDVGCGSGYLAIIAASLFSEADQITLIDLDDLTVLQAAENLAMEVSDRFGRESGSVDSQGAKSPAIRLKSGGFDRHSKLPRHRLMICNPPYLPELQRASTGMERSTNGTVLLNDVVLSAPDTADFTMIALSELAWREFEQSMIQVAGRLRRVVVYSRQVVPLRLPTIEPILPSENRGLPKRDAERQFEQRLDYYDSVLRPRGLIDLDDESWDDTLGTRVFNSAIPRSSDLRGEVLIEDQSDMSMDRYERCLRMLRDNSWGFRFWHEIRVVLLDARR